MMEHLARQKVESLLGMALFVQLHLRERCHG
jgi:hypothetical protein